MTSAATTVDYYEVFELALSELSRVCGEYRRHFGASSHPSPPGYCWFKGVTAPERHPDYADWLRKAGDELEDRLLAELPRVAPRRILDVGCGNGALLQRLARDCPGAELTGINFQPTQLQTAKRLLAGTRVELVQGDFLQQPLPGEYDVALLFESAFHMPDKAQLCRRLAEVLAPGGEVWLIDIVVAERAAEAFESMGRDALFNYVPRRVWQERFRACGLEETEFIDFSAGAAGVLQVSELPVLERDYLRPRLSTAMPGSGSEHDARLEHAVKVMVQIATEYRRLSRLLRGGMLQYVLMRYRKTG